MLFFRTVGAIVIAAVACLVPEVGPYRFWVAGILVFFCVPAAIWLEFNYPVAENGWSEPLFDLTMVVSLVHLAPAMWFTVLVMGLMIVQAPSIGMSRSSYLFYSLFALILTVGMTLAALLHDVDGWELPILTMVVLYPSVIFYSHWQARRANEVRDRAKTLEGLSLVAGGVAHDFNNILTGVMGHAELALLGLPEDHPSRESIREVLNGADRASLLSARLLAFSGRNTPSDESLDPELEIRELVALMGPVVADGITIDLVSGLSGERVNADRVQLQQVVMNLILNASEATLELPGTVAVALAIEHDATESWLSVTVSDQGVGVPEDSYSKIFDPFYTSKERGHGLGLASADKIVRDLGGEITIESSEAGTQAVVRLPALPPSEPASEESSAVPHRGGVALVVDDEEAVRVMLSRMLAHLDYRVIEAHGGAQAVDLFRESAAEIDLVMLDLRMPGMDGWTCHSAMRQICPQTPIIICSGYNPDESTDRHVDGNTTFLAKPFRLAEVSAAISRAIGTLSVTSS